MSNPDIDRRPVTPAIDCAICGFEIRPHHTLICDDNEAAMHIDCWMGTP
jgi:hypothetical protein